MSDLPNDAALKEITAYKKKLNWGDVPPIYHMVAGSISEMEGTLTSGFDNTFRRMLNKKSWNLSFLGGESDVAGNISVKHKPKINLFHVYSDLHYELHCLPVVKNDHLEIPLSEHPDCPFAKWEPESMQMLFRISSLVSFAKYTFQGGDKADLALINHAHLVVESHIKYLMESFDIISVKGDDLATFFSQLFKSSQRFNEEDFNNLSPSTIKIPCEKTD